MRRSESQPGAANDEKSVLQPLAAITTRKCRRRVNSVWD